ncbi:MAG: ATP-binding protein [Polaromonas sp.]|nr:ATP-binding protein [Polaromonas sp.]
MLSSWGLRSRLALLTGLALLPVFGLFAWIAAGNQQDALQLAQSRLQSDALLLAASQQPLVDAAKQLLGDIANAPTVRDGPPALCGDYLNKLQALQPAYAELGVAAPDGTLLCHSQSAQVGKPAADLAVLQSAIGGGQFVAGDYATGSSSGRSGVTFALPVYSTEGMLRTVVFAAVDVHAFGAGLAMVPFGNEVHAVLTDRKGTVLAAHPPGAARVGSQQADAAVRAFLGAPNIRSRQAVDADGRERLYAFATVPGAAGDALFAAVTMPRAGIAAKSRQTLMAELAILLVMAVFGMACAGWVGKRLVVRPAEAILREANELAVGNLAARVEVGPAYQGELGHLARTFNRMAESLELRRAELDNALDRVGREHRLLDLIINSMSEGVIAADVDGRFLLFNAAARKIFNEEADTSLSEWRQRHDLLTPDGHTFYADEDRPLSRALRGESADNFDVLLRMPGTGDRMLRMNLRPLRDEHRALIGGLAVFTDITDRKVAALELARITRALKMLSRCNEALTRIDDEKELLLQVCQLAVDVGGYRMAWVGYAQDDAARSIVPMAHAGHEGGYLSAIQLSWDAGGATGRGPAGQTLRTGEVRVSEDIARGDNQFHWSEEAAQHGYRSAVFLPLRDSSRTFGLLGMYSATVEKPTGEEIRLLQELADNLAFGIGSVRSRLERQQAQEEVLRLNVELEERVRQRTAQLQAANRELESFSYSVSHDLRTPLSAIDGFSGLLDKDIGEGGMTSERGRHYLKRIRAGVSQMGELIDALLSLARVTKTSLRWERVDLSAMAAKTLAAHREREPDRDVELHIDPGMAADGDPRLLQQLLENLLGNAWKFSERQPQTRIVFTSSTGAQGETVYTVRDQGAGFDMTYSGKLFGAFQRLHTVTEFEGTGIGLATVHRIVMRHGGRVWAESSPGEGAAFHFTLGKQPTDD